MSLKAVPVRALSLILIAGLAACSTGPSGIRVVNGSASSKPQPEPIRNFGAAEIQAAIAGKTFQYTRADGNGFVTVTTWTYTVKEADLLLSVLSLDLGTWSAANYDVRARVMRADAVTLAADWSDTLDVDLTTSSGIAALYLMMEAA